MPETFRTAAKFWVGLIGAIVIAIVTIMGNDAPQWLNIVVAALAAIGVYLTPNTTPAAPVLTGHDLEAAQKAAAAVDELPDAEPDAAA